MSLSRRLFLGAPLAAIAVARAAHAEAEVAPAVISRFYDDLLAVMKLGKQTPFDQRYSRLAPAVARTFDLALMTRIAIGPGWTRIDPANQQRLTAAFSQYTISEYTSRFDQYAGEKFEVSPATTQNPNGILVNTRLVRPNGETVPLSYLMRQTAPGGWQAIDVYLNGTISELASRRSEFAAVLQQGGAEALVRMLEQRAAAARTG